MGTLDLPLAGTPAAAARAARRSAAVMLAGCCAFLGVYATQPLLPLLEEVFGAGKVAVSLTVTATTLGVALAAPLAGSIADRFGRKRVIVWSAALLAAATLLDATAPSLPALIFWRFVQGAVTPGVFVVTIAYIQEEWGASGAGAATAVYVTGTVIGGFVGRVASGIAASLVGWHGSFVAIGALGAASALALAAWLPRERSAAVRASHGSPLAAAARHAANPRLVATWLAGFCVLFSLLGTFTYVTFYLAAPPFRLSPAAMGSMFAVYLVGAVITPPCGRAIDHFGHRPCLALAMVASSAGILLTLSHALPVVIAGLALCCSGVFVAQAAASSYLGVAADRDRALAVGLYVTLYYTGGSLGAALPGLAWDFGGWPACVALFTSVQAVVVVLVLAFWKPVVR